MVEVINSIHMEDILYKLWIKENNGSLYEDWKITSWWKLNKSWNYVNDFSKDRAKWGPFAFVKNYLNLTARETFLRFEKEYWINPNSTTKTKIKKRKEVVNEPLPRYFL